MALCEDLQAFCDAVNNAVDETMLVDVANLAKSEISMEGFERVYDAYNPKFYSRRGDKLGGILDTDETQTSYDGVGKTVKTLEIRSGARFQHLWGGQYPQGEDLTDAVESGNRRFNMGLAGPRPFYSFAEDRLEKSGLFDKTLETGVENSVGWRKF